MSRIGSWLVLAFAFLVAKGVSSSAQDAGTLLCADCAPPGVFRGQVAPPADVVGGLSTVHDRPLPSYAGKIAREIAPRGPLPQPERWLDSADSAQAPASPSDSFVSEGSEVAVAVDEYAGDRIIACQNPAPALRVSEDGNRSWSTRLFPLATDPFIGSPYDPWVAAGNAENEFFASMIRQDSDPKARARVVLARSTDGGESWANFFTEEKGVFDDRAMFDVDRVEQLGGGPGSEHDGKIYLTYDDFDPDHPSDEGEDYLGSRLAVLSPEGDVVTRLTLVTAANFNGYGYQFQPVAGTNDGQVWLLSQRDLTEDDQLRQILYLHELRNADSILRKVSTMTFTPAGQRLPSSRRHGVNGHRIGSPSMDIDRSQGPRRGTLYLISDRNPNPSRRDRDQGDVHLSISTNGARAWSDSVLPVLAPGRTQFFSMLDVDQEGWIHVAYYQNDAGTGNGGVLNATIANVYYTYSTDGGATWAPPVQVNDPANAIHYDDPPLDLRPNYYLIGDYQQVRASRIEGAPVAYVCWTQYDRARTDRFYGDGSRRVLCTTIHPGTGPGPSEPEPTPGRQALEFRQNRQLQGELSAPFELTLSPPPEEKYLYVTSGATPSIATLARAADGRLTLVDREEFPLAADIEASGLGSIRVSPDGRQLYAAVLRDDAVAVFDRDLNSGALSFRELFAYTDGVSPDEKGTFALAFSPDGAQLYVGRDGQPAVVVLARDVASGSLAVGQIVGDEIENLGTTPDVQGLAVDLDNVYATASRADALLVFGRDRDDGRLSLIQVHRRSGPDGNPFLDGPRQIVLSQDGTQLYLSAHGESSDLVATFIREEGDGRLRFLDALQDGTGGAEDLDGISGVALAPLGGSLLATGRFAGSLTTLGRDGITGGLHFADVQRNGRNGVSGLAGAARVAVTADGVNAYVTGLFDDAVGVFADPRAFSPTPTTTPAMTPTRTSTPTRRSTNTRRPTSTPAGPQPCVGDCNSDHVVTVSELIVAIDILLGHRPAQACMDLDQNNDLQVTLDEVVHAVAAALFTCLHEG